MTLRLVTYNICRGGRGREQALISVLRSCQADLVVLQEATRPDIVETLARGTGSRHWGSRPSWSLGFLSRNELRHAGWYRPRFSRHAFLELVPTERAPMVFGVHFSAVFAAWTERRRTMELRALLKSIARHETGFHLLVGDFNTLAPGELLDLSKLPARLKALMWLSGGAVRWRTIQLVLDHGYVDAYRTLHPAHAGRTFPTWDPHVRLDYVFVPTGNVERVKSCEVVHHPDAGAASDHFPLLIEVEI